MGHFPVLRHIQKLPIVLDVDVLLLRHDVHYSTVSMSLLGRSYWVIFSCIILTGSNN
jgi:hypothetical protein